MKDPILNCPSITSWSLVLFLAGSMPAYAFGGADGGDGSGTGESEGVGCCVPSSLSDDAVNFQMQIQNFELEDLRRRQFVGELCSPVGLACGRLSELQASRLLDHHVNNERRVSENAERSMRWRLDLALAFVAGLGLILGGYSTFFKR